MWAEVSRRNFYTTCEYKMPVVEFNRFRDKFSLMSAMSKITFGFVAVFNENMQNMMTIRDYTIKKTHLYHLVFFSRITKYR